MRRFARFRRARRVVLLAAAVPAIAGLGFLLLVFSDVLSFWRTDAHSRTAEAGMPSRLLARELVLLSGESMSAAEAARLLDAAGYREQGAEELTPGRYRVIADEVYFATAAGELPRGTPVRLRFAGAALAEIATGDRVRSRLELGTPLLATIYGDDLIERRPIRLDELPEHVVQAILAAEDGDFFKHPGVSLAGITRAALVNLRAGKVRQGGSTISQQLAKMRYLTSERTVMRKLREAMLAVLLERGFGKREILEAYLNEIYLGRSGPIQLVGLGAGAAAYFAKPASELTVAEAATLAGLIHEPGRYAPHDRPEGVLARRADVLQRMVRQRWLSDEQARAARDSPLDVAPPHLARRLAPYLLEPVIAEAFARWGLDDLGRAGLTLQSTLDLKDQLRAEQALVEGLDRLAAQRRPDLQGALVSLEPGSGAVLAWVGGREWPASQFDRVAQARRPAASSFKPIVFIAAFANRVAVPADFVDDSPLIVQVGTQIWEPQNNDRRFRGPVTVRRAIELSLNVPTVRLALATGLHSIAATAEAVGLPAVEPLPSLALGAIDVSPLELATAYATLAAGGVRPTPFILAQVRDGEGRPLAAPPPLLREPVLRGQIASLVTALLQGVLDRGTAASARRAGISERLAGKTGTSDDGRDAWFAGFSPDRVTVVWVGRDDNQPARLTGSRAALPIWARFTAAVRPPGGFPPFPPPIELTSVPIDPGSGLLASADCPHRLVELFPAGTEPWQQCTLHEPFVPPVTLSGMDGIEVRLLDGGFGRQVPLSTSPLHAARPFRSAVEYTVPAALPALPTHERPAAAPVPAGPRAP